MRFQPRRTAIRWVVRILIDFNWVILPYEIPDVDRDMCVLPDEFPVVVDRTAA